MPSLTPLAVSALLCLSVSFAGAAPADPLWLKAVETARGCAAWTPGTIRIHAEVFNDKGVLTDTRETVMQVERGADGKPRTTVVSSVKNGRDETEKDRRAFADRERKPDGGRSFSVGAEDNPFNPDVQAAVTATRTGETAATNGKECALFRFTLKRRDGSAFAGTAALDAASGAPVEVRYTASPLPFGVKTMDTVMKFGDGPGGSAGFLTELDVSGSGSFLFVSRSMTSTIVLEDYWKTGG